ncbi:hypothetical protein BDA99DRAFT_329495 [Phascolomyces articulosus]|uniref:Uncharacterized protein n=1 Tax=Phascolomyces articulosus TaxID=60185 RepID=A0AAD5K627_9FUNG|nr:hypothetical protein BDA99DRAFT_329495 [Phascolomyces articulosus]
MGAEAKRLIYEGKNKKILLPSAEEETEMMQDEEEEEEAQQEEPIYIPSNNEDDDEDDDFVDDSISYIKPKPTRPTPVLQAKENRHSPQKRTREEKGKQPLYLRGEQKSTSTDNQRLERHPSQQTSTPQQTSTSQRSSISRQTSIARQRSTARQTSGSRQISSSRESSCSWQPSQQSTASQQRSSLERPSTSNLYSSDSASTSTTAAPLSRLSHHDMLKAEVDMRLGQNRSAPPVPPRRSIPSKHIPNISMLRKRFASEIANEPAPVVQQQKRSNSFLTIKRPPPQKITKPPTLGIDELLSKIEETEMDKRRSSSYYSH